MAGLNRAVHVAAVSQDGIPGPGTDGFVEETLRRLEMASCRRPDIVCLPEGFPGRAESVPGPLSDRLGAWAREKSCYVIAPYHVLADGHTFNSAVVIDRRGKVVGRYDKIHPTEGELAKGIRPGRPDPPVFRTDFGTIGIQICFDVNWTEDWRALKEKGAEIVFFPAAYPATRHMATLARWFQYYVVSSARTRPSCIFDITGDVLASSGMFQPWADATIHLSKRLFEIDFHVAKMRQVEAKYGRRVLVQWYHNEDQFTLASLDPELAVEDVIAEFGLLPLPDYVARCALAQGAAREA